MDMDLERLANEKIGRVIDEYTWMEPDILSRVATSVRLENTSCEIRRLRLRSIADRFNEALAPYAACKAGCSQCCSLPTMIYEHEAKILEEASGRKQAPLRPRAPDVALTNARTYFGIPCPFLKADRCSVYEARPLICRLHHSLNPTADACDVSPPFEERKPVARYDVDVIEVPYHLLILEQTPNEAWGSIHEFFPQR